MIKPIFSYCYFLQLINAILLFLTNYVFIIEVYQHTTNNIFFITTLLNFFNILFLISTITSINKYLFTIINIFLYLIGSVVSYFKYFYKISITPTLAQVVFGTDTNEVSELINITLIIWIIIFGLVPILIIYFIVKSKVWSNTCEFPQSMICFFYNIIISFILYLIVISISSQNIKTLIKPVGNFMPFNYIMAINSYNNMSKRYSSMEDINHISNPSLQEAIQSNLQVILVIGESARSDHFQINGYARETTPNLLAINNLISYKEAYSLATCTKEGVMAIMKKYGKENYTSFISIFNKLGFKTHWFSAQKTCYTNVNSVIKEVDNVVYYDDVNHVDINNPYDSNLLPFIEKAANNENSNLIIVHTQGSHKLYDLRYPDNFKKFSPICIENKYYYYSTPECLDTKKLINSYDNSILYTDYFLYEVIKIFKDKKAFLIYLSDHGESLGENGVLGHAAPIERAPISQIHIPLIVWASDSFLENKTLNNNFKIAQTKKDQKMNQSFIFNSILDCVNIKADSIDKDKSICKPGTLSTK